MSVGASARVSILRVTPLHSADHGLNDAILSAGVAYYVRAVRAELPGIRA